MPVLLLQIALMIIAARSVYVLVKTQLPKKNWIEALYHASVAVVAVYFLL